MIKLRVIHTISAVALIVLFAVSVVLSFLASSDLFGSLIFSFMNIVGATFPPSPAFIDARNPLMLLAVSLGVLGNISFTILFTTIFYQALSGIDVGYAFAKRSLRTLHQHVIVTPINSMGLEMTKKLKKNGIECVMIDEDMNNVKTALAEGVLAIRGNAAAHEVLQEARIDKALALLALDDDVTKNALVTMAADKAKPSLRIISRIKRIDDIPKVEKAGARRTVLPEFAVGIEMSNYLLSKL